MKKQLKPLLYVAVVLGMSVSCKTNDRTTIVFGTVKDDLGKPIVGMPVELYGEKGILGSRSALLKATKTDTKGEYNVTTEIPKDYLSGDVFFQPDEKLSEQYSFFEIQVYFNEQKTSGCCIVKIGQKNQYDLIFTRK